jgi:NADH-quinone oxidoreductase subunit N
MDALKNLITFNNVIMALTALLCLGVLAYIKKNWSLLSFRWKNIATNIKNWKYFLFGSIPIIIDIFPGTIKTEKQKVVYPDTKVNPVDKVLLGPEKYKELMDAYKTGTNFPPSPADVIIADANLNDAIAKAREPFSISKQAEINAVNAYDYAVLKESFKNVWEACDHISKTCDKAIQATTTLNHAYKMIEDRLHQIKIGAKDTTMMEMNMAEVLKIDLAQIEKGVKKLKEDYNHEMVANIRNVVQDFKNNEDLAKRVDIVNQTEVFQSYKELDEKLPYLKDKLRLETIDFLKKHPTEHIAKFEKLLSKDFGVDKPMVQYLIDQLHSLDTKTADLAKSINYKKDLWLSSENLAAESHPELVERFLEFPVAIDTFLDHSVPDATAHKLVKVGKPWETFANLVPDNSDELLKFIYNFLKLKQELPLVAVYSYYLDLVKIGAGKYKIFRQLIRCENGKPNVLIQKLIDMNPETYGKMPLEDIINKFWRDPDNTVKLLTRIAERDELHSLVRVDVKNQLLEGMPLELLNYTKERFFTSYNNSYENYAEFLSLNKKTPKTYNNYYENEILDILDETLSQVQVFFEKIKIWYANWFPFKLLVNQYANSIISEALSTQVIEFFKASYQFIFVETNSIMFNYFYLIFGVFITIFLRKIKTSKNNLEFIFKQFNNLNILVLIWLLVHWFKITSNIYDLPVEYLLEQSQTKLSLSLKVLITTSVLLYFNFSQNSIYLFEKKPENFVILPFLFYFLFNIVDAENLLILFTNTLGTSLGLALSIISIKKTSIEASYKYLLQSAILGTFFMTGVGLLIFSTNGSLNIIEIQILTRWNFIEGVFTLVLLTILFKLSQFPNHHWAPEIYAGISSPVLFLFLVPMKIGFIGFVYKVFTLLATQHYILNIFFISCNISIIIGSLGSLSQDNIAKFLGWTGISNVGFILLPIILPQIELSYSLAISFYFLLIYAISLTLLLITISNIKVNNNTNINEFNQYSEINLINYNNSNKTLLVILLLFIGGVPPFALFLAKLNVLVNFFSSWLSLNSTLFSFYGVIVNFNFNYFYFLLFIMLLIFGMGVGLYVYIVIVGKLFLEKQSTTNFETKLINSNLNFSLFTVGTLIYISIEGSSIFNWIKFIVI